jgi:hypothetical protein
LNPIWIFLKNSRLSLNLTLSSLLSSDIKYNSVIRSNIVILDDSLPFSKLRQNLIGSIIYVKFSNDKDDNCVWIFRGDSNLGKSYLAHCSDLSVFETDAHSTLPHNITEDIIVLGNKYCHSLNDIKSCVTKTIIIVDFLFVGNSYHPANNFSFDKNLKFDHSLPHKWDINLHYFTDEQFKLTVLTIMLIFRNFRCLTKDIKHEIIRHLFPFYNK